MTNYLRIKLAHALHGARFVLVNPSTDEAKNAAVTMLNEAIKAMDEEVHSDLTQAEHDNNARMHLEDRAAGRDNAAQRGT